MKIGEERKAFMSSLRRGRKATPTNQTIVTRKDREDHYDSLRPAGLPRGKGQGTKGEREI